MSHTPSSRNDAGAPTAGERTTPSEETRDDEVIELNIQGLDNSSSKKPASARSACGSIAAFARSGAAPDWDSTSNISSNSAAESASANKKKKKPGPKRKAGRPRGSAVRPIGSPPQDDEVRCPQGVPEQVWQRVQDFTPPHGYEKVPIPPGATSLVWYAGVKVIHLESKVEAWICLASDECSETVEVRLWTGANSNWVRHLITHGLQSVRGNKIKATKIEACERLEAAAKTNFFKMGPHRYRNVMQVRVLVKKFQPFNYVEDKDVRHHHSAMMMNPDGKLEPTPHLSVKGVKHVLLETYSATKAAETGRLRDLADSACLPCVHLNVDKWDDEGSKRAFLGVRAFWVEEWTLRSSNLALKLYDPPSTLTKLKASEVLMKWTDYVLAEHRLSSDDIYSSTSDSGSDIKRMLDVLYDAEWAWCVPHMANRALTEATGMDGDPARSKNRACREAINAVKSVVGHLNKSGKMKKKFDELMKEKVGKTVKLVNDAPHRWLTLVNVVEVILSVWPVLRIHYRKNEKASFPLENSEDIIPQLFALFYPVYDVIKESQASSTWTAARTVVNMAELKVGVLNPAVPLAVTPIPDSFAFEDKEYTARPVEIANEDLAPVVRETRTMLADAFVTRYYAPYWDASTCIIVDMALALYPPLKKLRYMLNMRLTKEEVATRGGKEGTSEAEVCAKQQRVYGEIKKQAVAVAKKVRDRTTGPNTQGTRPESDLRPAAPGPKRPKITTSRDARLEEEAARYDHLVDSSDSESEVAKAATPEGEVEAEWDSYMSMKKVGIREVPFEGALAWWGQYGSKEFRWLSHVARSVFGHPATAAAIERDFSSAGHMLTPQRSRLDAVHVEMLMYLNLNYDKIPNYIPEISQVHAYQHLPARLAELDDMDESIVPEDDESGDVDPTSGAEAGVEESKS